MKTIEIEDSLALRTVEDPETMLRLLGRKLQHTGKQGSSDDLR